MEENFENLSDSEQLDSNIWEEPNAYYLEVSLPGISLENISLYSDGEILKLQATRLAQTPCSGKCLKKEIKDGCFGGSYRLPFRVDTESVEARYSNGLLRIRLSKAPNNLNGFNNGELKRIAVVGRR